MNEITPPALPATVRAPQAAAAGLGTAGTSSGPMGRNSGQSSKRELRFVMFNQCENEHTGVVQPRKEQTEENVSLKYYQTF